MGLSLCDIGQHFSFCCVWVTCRGVSYAQDMWVVIFQFFFYIFCNIAIQSIAKISSHKILQKTKFFSEFLDKEHDSSAHLFNSTVEKNVRKFSNTIDLQCKSSNLHCKCIRVNPPLLPSDCGEFFIFSFFINFELIKSIWGKLHNLLPTELLRLKFLKLKMDDNFACPHT